MPRILRVSSLREAFDAIAEGNPDIIGLEINSAIKSLTDDDIFILTQALATNPHITTLNLSHNRITERGAQFLAATNLENLNISWNNITDAGAAALAANPNLKTLIADNCGLTNAGAQALATSQSIINLYISNNRIHEEALQALALNPVLRSLRITNSNLTDLDAQILAQSQFITSLNLQNNDIGQIGAQAFAANQFLTHLNLCDNKITNQGAKYLAQNRNLIALNISGNRLVFSSDPNSSAQDFAQNNTLRELDISSNNFFDSGLEILMRNLALSALNFQSLSQVDRAISANLRARIAQNKELQPLYQEITRIFASTDILTKPLILELFQLISQNPNVLDMINIESEAKYQYITETLAQTMYEGLNSATPFQRPLLPLELTDEIIRYPFSDNPRNVGSLGDQEAVELKKIFSNFRNFIEYLNLPATENPVATFVNRLLKDQIPSVNERGESTWNVFTPQTLDKVLKRYLFETNPSQEELLHRLELITRTDGINIFGIQSRHDFREIIANVTKNYAATHQASCTTINRFFREIAPTTQKTGARALEAAADRRIVPSSTTLATATGGASRLQPDSQPHLSKT